VCSHPGARERLRRALWPGVFWVGVVLFVLASRLRSGSAPSEIAWLSFGSVLFPAMLMATMLHPGSLAGRLLEWPPLRWIGRLSYSLYLWQQLFFVLPSSRMSLLGRLQDWPVNVACVFACAIASYYLVEKPFIREGYRRTAQPLAA